MGCASAGQDVKQSLLMCKYDVIREIECTKRIATLPDRATAIGNMHKILAKIGRVVTSSGDIIADRQTDTVISIPIRNEIVPIQLAQCWFHGLTISSAKNKYIFHVKYTEAILSNCTRKLGAMV